MESSGFAVISNLIDILFDPDDIFQAVRKAFSEISELFGIIEADVKISSSASENINNIVFKKNDDHSDNFTESKFNYGNPENLNIEITIKRNSLVILSQEDEKQLICCIKIIYAFLSKQKYETIVETSKMYDIKTGFLSLQGFYKKFAEIFIKNQQQNYSLFFMNVKDFKLINRKYGHEEGSKIMGQISRNINIFLNSNSFFAHLGGDNFLVCIENCDVNLFIKLISKFPVETKNFKGEKENYYLSFHAGICRDFSSDDVNKSNAPANISKFIENASIAMNISKRNPSMNGIVYFNDEIRKMIMREKEIEASMHKALEDGEFVVFYQPKVSLTDYSLKGAEALIRWKRNGKIVPPDSFIPIFEKNGFVCQIDFYVLDTVCKKIRNWLERGIEPVKISVNFSKIHTDNPNLVDNITDVIVRNGISSKYIEIEFTETSYIDNSSKVYNIITKLKEAGIMVSMDDFGTGFSSLNMLKEMPIDILKLDKSFLNVDGTISKREEVIIKNVIRMAKELDMEVISEGVEKYEHIVLLQNLNCDTAQGYFFDKPLSLEDYEKRLIKHNYNDKKPLTAEV